MCRAGCKTLLTVSSYHFELFNYRCECKRLPGKTRLQYDLLCVFDVLIAVCFELSVPVQVIAWKDSTPK